MKGHHAKCIVGELRTANRKTNVLSHEEAGKLSGSRQNKTRESAITQVCFNYTTSVQLTRAQKMVGSSPILKQQPHSQIRKDSKGGVVNKALIRLIRLLSRRAQSRRATWALGVVWGRLSKSPPTTPERLGPNLFDARAILICTDLRRAGRSRANRGGGGRRLRTTGAVLGVLRPLFGRGLRSGTPVVVV